MGSLKTVPAVWLLAAVLGYFAAMGPAVCWHEASQLIEINTDSNIVIEITMDLVALPATIAFYVLLLFGLLSLRYNQKRARTPHK